MSLELEPGEKIIFEGHPSWRSILDFYAKGVLAIVVLGAIVAGVTRVVDDEVDTGLVVAVALIGLVLLLVAGYVKRLFTKYVISNHRLYIKRGIVARHEQQTHITRVQNVNTNQGVFQRLLQIGDVNFDTAAHDDYDFQFGGVAEPRDVVEAVHRAQREADSPQINRMA